jgi:hypothetical protein
MLHHSKIPRSNRLADWLAFYRQARMLSNHHNPTVRAVARRNLNTMLFVEDNNSHNLASENEK